MDEDDYPRRYKKPWWECLKQKKTPAVTDEIKRLYQDIEDRIQSGEEDNYPDDEERR